MHFFVFVQVDHSISSYHFNMVNLLRNIEIYYVILGIDTPIAPD